MSVKMMMCVGLSLCFCITAAGQSETSRFQGWLAFMHEQTLNKKWSLLADVQFRSANHFNYFETVLLRPGVQYAVTEKTSVAVGYAYLGNWEKQDGEKSFSKEHRSWEQVQRKDQLKRTELTNRLRLEQRFVENGDRYDFSQRLRYYLRLQFPLNKAPEFRKGWYAAAQNECFANIQHRERVNGKFFDQNRTYVSLGYRFSKALDLEAGYLYRYQVEDVKRHDHVVQVMLGTKL